MASQWPLCVIASDEQISQPSLVWKQNSSHLHSLCVGILFNCTALGIHLCKTSQLYILKTRLGGEIYSSDVNMHKGYCFCSSLNFSPKLNFLWKCTRLRILWCLSSALRGFTKIYMWGISKDKLFTGYFCKYFTTNSFQKCLFNITYTKPLETATHVRFRKTEMYI